AGDLRQGCRFFESCHRRRRGLLSLPTRRSSDLGTRARSRLLHSLVSDTFDNELAIQKQALAINVKLASGYLALVIRTEDASSLRSEEHTSELQSPYDLVCRLLLEKKSAAMIAG